MRSAVRPAIASLFFCSLGSLAIAQTLDSDVPFADTPAARTSDGTRVEASAVGLPDERLPMVEARCTAARRLAERRARSMLHDYADSALRMSRATPAVIVELHRVVDERTTVTGTRGLIDCGAVVRVSVPFSALEAVARGAEVTFP